MSGLPRRNYLIMIFSVITSRIRLLFTAIPSMGCKIFVSILGYLVARGMMGFLGIGNNPMVGATVAIAVDIAGALSK